MSKNTIYIDAVIDDKGTIGQVAIEAKAARAALKAMTGAALETDRGIKGVGQQSSNSTKNFSKMAGTINAGIVPAYATLAAELFVVSAAYQFLKSAGNLKMLQEGQVAYASATGIALRSLTKDIIAATDAQITFADASQAAAIGISSGLSPDQMVKIGEAAKSASIILGRDVTDSFNRLTRGITKAEPELLDELGIILRLETATTKYAAEIGKTANELTAFERSQAVANEVLGQAEEKYNKIIKIVDPSVNNFAQLGIAMDELINKIKLLVGEIAGPLATVLTKFPELALLSIGLLLRKVVAAALPGLGNLSDATDRMTEKAQLGLAKAKAAADDYRKSLVAAAMADRQATAAAAASRAQSMVGGLSFKSGSGFDKLQKGDFASISSQNLTGMMSAVKSNSAQFKAMSAANRAALEADLKMMLLSTKKDVSQIDAQWKLFFASHSTLTHKMRLAWASTMTFMASAAKAVGSALTIAMSVIGWVGLVVTLGMVVKEMWFAKEATDEIATSMSKLTEKVSGLNEEYKLFDLIQSELNKEGGRTLAFLEAFGNRIGSLSTYQTRDMLQELAAGIDGYAFSLSNAASELEALSNGWNNFSPIAGGRRARATEIAGSSFTDYLKNQGTDSQKAFVQYLEDQVKSLESSEDAYAKNTTVFANYIGSIKQFLQAGGSKEFIETILQQQNAVGELTVKLSGLARQQKDNMDVSAGLMRAFMPDTDYDKAVNTLKAEFGDLIVVLREVSKLGEEEYNTKVARMDTIREEIKLFTQLNEQEHSNNKIKEEAKALQIRQGIGLTPGQSSLYKQEVEAFNLARERLELEQSRALIQSVIDKKGENVAVAQRNLEINSLLLDTVRAQEEALVRQRDLVWQIADGANAAFEGALQSGLAGLIKGDETSIKNAVLTIAKTTVSSVADTLSKQMTDKIMGRSPAQVAMTQAKIISTSFLSAGQQVATMISNAVLGHPTANTTSVVSAAGSIVGQSTGSSRVGGLLNMLKSAASFALPNLVPYANGGIVTKPTAAIIGEGRYNEAVIPMPDGKRVPVDIKGGGGQNNNVEVTIIMDGNGAKTSTNGSGADANALGNAIAKAVQKELQNQKRSGGMLNPYGVS